jgi:hypothetical protein
MKKILPLVIALAAGTAAQASPLGVSRSTLAPPALATTVHGCHSSYGHDIRGWHRHGKGCEAQRGLTRKRDRKRTI